jgi:hypothetical protein
MSRIFKPGESVRVIELLSLPGHNEMGEDGQPVWVEPHLKVISRVTTVAIDGKSIPAHDGTRTIPIDPEMTFHMDELQESRAKGQELADQLASQGLS